jgi:exonuclease III
MTLRGRWCDIIVLNVHAPAEDKRDDTKDSFYEELERVFNQFSKYHMKILLGDFNAKGGGEILSNQKSGMRAYMKALVIMGFQHLTV